MEKPKIDSIFEPEENENSMFVHKIGKKVKTYGIYDTL